MRRTKFIALIALGLSFVFSAITRGASLVPITPVYAAQSEPSVSSPGQDKLDGITCASCHAETTHLYLPHPAASINLPAYSTIRSQILAGLPDWHHETDGQNGTFDTEALYTILNAQHNVDQGQMDGYFGPIVQCAFCHSELIEQSSLHTLESE